MFATGRALFVLALGLGFVGSPAALADDKKGENVKKPQPSAEPVKPIVIQIDASKLPPEVLKQLLQLADKPKPTSEPVKPTGDKPKPKPGGEPEKPSTKPTGEGSKPAVKAISLAEAIAIAEKTTKGKVTKAEQQVDEGTVQFKIEVQDGKGIKSKLTLDASGKVAGADKKEGEKAAPKKKDDDKDEKAAPKKKGDDKEEKAAPKKKDDDKEEKAPPKKKG
ncbi:MAG: PepSY domain-containing protein [Gemmata sp.]